MVAPERVCHAPAMDQISVDRAMAGTGCLVAGAIPTDVHARMASQRQGCPVHMDRISASHVMVGIGPQVIDAMEKVINPSTSRLRPVHCALRIAISRPSLNAVQPLATSDMRSQQLTMAQMIILTATSITEICLVGKYSSTRLETATVAQICTLRCV